MDCTSGMQYPVKTKGIRSFPKFKKIACGGLFSGNALPMKIRIIDIFSGNTLSIKKRFIYARAKNQGKDARGDAKIFISCG